MTGHVVPGNGLRRIPLLVQFPFMYVILGSYFAVHPVSGPCVRPSCSPALLAPYPTLSVTQVFCYMRRLVSLSSITRTPIHLRGVVALDTRLSRIS
jgi:hypothetical protein